MPRYVDRRDNSLSCELDFRSRKGEVAIDSGDRRGYHYPLPNPNGGDSKDPMLPKACSVNCPHEDSGAVGCLESRDYGSSLRIKVDGRSCASCSRELERFNIYDGNKRMGLGLHQERCSGKMFTVDLIEKQELRNKLQDVKNLHMSSSNDLKLKLYIDDESKSRKTGTEEVVSCLTGYAKCFFEDEIFLASTRRSCVTCLTNGGMSDKHHAYGSFVSLKESITIVERVARKSLDVEELKKASLTLNAIAGLNSKSSINQFTSGFANSSLAACACLYLGIIYTSRKEEKVSAMYLLQVFFILPHQARKILLPALWNHLFFPHLSRLKTWFDKEMKLIPHSCTIENEIKILQKMYQDVVDSFTQKLAGYFMEWIIGEAEVPLHPFIHLYSPSDSRSIGTHAFHRDEVYSPCGSFPSKLVASKRMCLSVSQNQEENQLDEMKKINLGNSGSLKKINKLLKKESAGQTDLTFIISRSHEEKNCKLSCDRLGAFSSGVKQTDEVCFSEQEVHKIQAKEHELALRKLAQEIFNQQRHNKIDSMPLKHFQNSTVFDKSTGNVKVKRAIHRAPVSKKARQPTFKSHLNLSGLSIRSKYCSKYQNISAQKNHYNISQDFIVSNTAGDFIYPLTGQHDKYNATKGPAQRCKQMGIKEWLGQGNQICNVTGVEPKNLSIPLINIESSLIDGWISECCPDFIAFASQRSGYRIKKQCLPKKYSACNIVNQLFAAFSSEERIENMRCLIGSGVLKFLMLRLDVGSLEEKMHVIWFLLYCIKADGSYRSYLAANLRSPCIIQLLHSNNMNLRTSTVLLLTELLCLRRRTSVKMFLTGLHKYATTSTTNLLLQHLQTSPPEEKILVSVLLLHFDLMFKPGIYRQEAVNDFTWALKCCLLAEKKMVPNACRALLILGGYFSESGDPLTEAWLLQQAGFSGASCLESVRYDDKTDHDIMEHRRWQEEVTMALLGDGSMTFVRALSECLAIADHEFVRACMATIAWMSQALVRLAASEILLSAFSVLIPHVRKYLAEADQIELSILASISLYSFSKVPECKRIILTFTEELYSPIAKLSEITTTGKQLYATLFRKIYKQSSKLLFE